MSINDTVKVPFRPVRGLQEDIQNMKTIDGYIYYATDSRKTYLGTAEDKKLLMGYDIGVFYGTKDIPVDNSGNTPDPNVFFNKDYIEGDRLPQVDDLILNKDGCFYRVKSISGSLGVNAERLTLQGTGGGGGGGADAPDLGYGWGISIPNSNIIYSTDAEKLDLFFKTTYTGNIENQIARAELYMGGIVDFERDTPFFTTTLNSDNNSMQFGGMESINITECKSIFTSSYTTITLALVDSYNVRHSTTAQIRLMKLTLSSTEDNLLVINNSQLKFKCSAVDDGETSNDIQEKTVVYTFFQDGEDSNSILTKSEAIKPASSNDPFEHTLDLSALGHGIYKMTVQAFAKTKNSNSTVSSNIKTYKIAHIENDNQSILLTLAPARVEQHTNFDIEYLYKTNSERIDYTMEIRIDNVFYKTFQIEANAIASYPFYFEDTNPKAITFTIKETGATTTEIIKLAEYTGILPIISTQRPDLMLYLNPRGKTNKDADRDIWKTSKDGDSISGKLIDVNYSDIDGWLTDVNGTNYLKLMSGARFEVPEKEFQPFATDLVNADKAEGLTVELDFEINGILDYTKPIISCVSYDGNGAPKVGFELIGTKLKFYNSRLNGVITEDGTQKGVLSNQTIVENKRIRISYVIEPKSINFPMCYTYLDGKMSAATSFKKGEDTFVDSEYRPANLKIDSAYAQIKIYGIRFYRSALKENVILNNYTASLPTLSEREKVFKSNQIYTNNVVDFTKVASNNYDLQIPYMKLTGGYKSISKDEKWTLALPANMEAGLPTGKKDYRLVDVEVVYPKNEYFAGYEDYKFINEYEKNGQKIPMSQAGGLSPKNGGAIMYAQGTSSLEYPVKNLRLRFKKEADWYKVRPTIEPVEIICMKADYMESSGSHNTGTANFIDDLYLSVNMATPGQKKFKGEGRPEIVTCIKGHPCLIFYSESPDGPYEYIGKYNLNLDKATPTPFGFKHTDDFGWLSPGEKYWKVQYGEQDENDNWTKVFVGQENPTDGADYVSNQVETEETVGAEDKINSIHCFEFLDNAVKVCNFLNKIKDDVLRPGETPPSEKSFYKEIELTSKTFKPKVYYIKDGDNYILANEFDENVTYYAINYTYEETWYNTVWDNKEQRFAPGWTLGFESRYPEDRIGYHDADMLWPLASWLHELYNIRYGLEGRVADPALALARFKNEYECYLDKKFTLTYYLVTEALLMADSRVKNMMIATWNKAQKSYYPLKQNDMGEWIPDITAEPIKTNNYIFYPLFYDMDTMLGLDNTGAPRFDYDAEDTDPATYNGDEVLWNFVRDALPTELIALYTDLEEGLLNAQDILPYYNLNQANMANEAMYNGDAKYKYVDKFRSGYHDDLYDKDYKAGEAPYLYAAQGDRSLSRESFINNRIRFLMGKYISNKFQKSDRLVYRQNCPNTPKEPPILEENERDPLKLEKRSAYYIPSGGAFNFTALKTGYAGINLGANGGLSVQRFNGEGDTGNITIDTTSANGTEAYLLGLSTLSDLGDLSDKYMQKFIVDSSDVRLRSLILGHPHRYYYNRYWGTVQGGQASEISLGGYDEKTKEPYGCLYLEEFNMQNCSTFTNSLDFSVCTAIEKIDLTGSGVSGITLPENGLLTELRLPSAINKLKIVGHKNLTSENFSMGPYVYDTTLPVKDQIIGAGNGHYTNNFQPLTSLHIVDTPIDSYEIVNGASVLETYYLHGINWEINDANPYMYCIRRPSWTYIDEETGKSTTLADKLQKGVQYYTSVIKNNKMTYEKYDGTEYPEGYVYLYEKVSMLDDNNNIVCVPILERLLTLKPDTKTDRHSDALSGTITIAVPGASVNELMIYDKYKTVYPNVTIQYDTDKVNVENAYRINFYPGSVDPQVDRLDGLLPEHFALTADKIYSLADLIGDYKPVKTSTESQVFNFTGQWVDWSDTEEKTIYYQDTEDITHVGVNEDYKFVNYHPDKDMNLIPIFSKDTRTYKVTLKEIRDNQTVTLAEADIPYGNDIGKFFEQGLKNYSNYSHALYNYKEHPNSENGYRWSFKGWKLDPNEMYVITYLNGEKATRDLTYFTYYEEEEINKTVSQIGSIDDFFTFEEIENGYQIKLNDKYKFLLQGAITLPSQYNGKPILSLAGFDGATKFTSIHFLSNAEYLEIAQNAFYCSSNITNPVQNCLKSIYLPSTVKTIGANAFYNNAELTNADLPAELKEIGGSAFWKCNSLQQNELPANFEKFNGNSNFYATKAKISQLPDTFNGEIPEWCFASCPKVNIKTFGSANKPVKIKSDAFNGAGDGTVNTITIYCADKESITKQEFTYTQANNYNSNAQYYIKEGEQYRAIELSDESDFVSNIYYTRTSISAAFANYNTADLQTLTIYGPEGADFTDVYGAWGLKITKDTTVLQPNKEVT